MASQAFPPLPQTVRRVRELIRDAVPNEDTYGLELVASELVTNVIRHANTELVVSVETHGSTARIEVSDGSSILPAVKDIATGAEGGMGLRLVETISEQWGAEQRPDGKVVWAEIRIGQDDPTP